MLGILGYIKLNVSNVINIYFAVAVYIRQSEIQTGEQLGFCNVKLNKRYVLNADIAFAADIAVVS